MVLEVKTALKDEHSEFVCIRAIEGVGLLKPSWRGHWHGGSVRGGWKANILVASVWASKAMAAAKSPPISGSGAEAVLVVAEWSSAGGWVARVNGIFKSESVSLVILLHAVLGNIWARGLGSGQVGFRWEFGVRTDLASASGSLC